MECGTTYNVYQMLRTLCIAQNALNHPFMILWCNCGMAPKQSSKVFLLLMPVQSPRIPKYIVPCAHEASYRIRWTDLGDVPNREL